MATNCFKCNKELVLPQGTVGRTAECSSCGADVHTCLNCKFYDRSVYNECREPQAERVLDKDRSNYCDFFGLRAGTLGSTVDPSAAAKKKLDDLFK